MIPFAVLAVLQTRFEAKEAGLSWRFPGTVKPLKGRYELVSNELRGEVHWFEAPKGKYEPEKLYKSDTLRTKEADATKGFSHVRTMTVFAGVKAIRSDQRYTWNGAPVVSRCVYAADRDRAWVVRLWWSPRSKFAPTLAGVFLESFQKISK
ncbi:hypothetical protein EON82_18975 [bacterium]|nr:MAG: hypothetical protein EON82_18975 [bacterium]